jgi:hypothetical protein
MRKQCPLFDKPATGHLKAVRVNRNTLRKHKHLRDCASRYQRVGALPLRLKKIPTVTVTATGRYQEKKALYRISPPP